MSLIQVDKIQDTVISWFEAERAVFDTIIDLYYTGRRVNFFLGRRPVIPSASLPSVEVSAVTDNISWHACRVQGVEPSLQIDITTDNQHPEMAQRLQASLVTLVTRILASPVHLLPHIQGTHTHFYDALPSDVKYDQTAQNGSQRVATVSWRGKYLEYLANRHFQPGLQIVGPRMNFPPV